MNIKNKKFKIVNEIVNFKIDDPVASKVGNFYEIDPFPNYGINDDKNRILQIGDQNSFLKSLKTFIGFNKNIVEIGAGTCQWSNYFAIGTNNNVCSFVSSFNSLEIGKNFAKKNNINNVSFVRGDVFEQIFHDEVFDFLICNGVLHHTKDPYKAFKIILKSVKKDGYIIIGLYNKFGRIRTKARKFFYKIFGKKLIMLFDPMIRNIKKNSEEQIEAWIRDQYKHPVESLHTFDEILGWFKSNNVEFVNSIPSCDFMSNNENIFEKIGDGNLISRILNQISMIFTPLGGDGGLFVFIGKKLM